MGSRLKVTVTFTYSDNKAMPVLYKSNIIPPGSTVVVVVRTDHRQAQ
jgi:hypothetical protein